MNSEYEIEYKPKNNVTHIASREEGFQHILESVRSNGERREMIIDNQSGHFLAWEIDDTIHDKRHDKRYPLPRNKKEELENLAKVLGDRKQDKKNPNIATIAVTGSEIAEMYDFVNSYVSEKTRYAHGETRDRVNFIRCRSLTRGMILNYPSSNYFVEEEKGKGQNLIQKALRAFRRR